MCVFECAQVGISLCRIIVFVCAQVGISLCRIIVFVCAQVGICLGLTAPSTLYGKLMPYLHSIDLHEHYYIQGPVGCEAEARQLFGRMGEMP